VTGLVGQPIGSGDGPTGPLGTPAHLRVPSAFGDVFAAWSLRDRGTVTWGDGVPTVTILDVVGRERTSAPQSSTGFEAFPWHGFALTVGTEQGVVDQPALRRPLLDLPRSLTRAGKVVSARGGGGEEPPRSRSEPAQIAPGDGPSTEWTMAATGRRGVVFRRGGSLVVTLEPRLRFCLAPGGNARDFAVAVALEATVSSHVFVL
jgi:hypothetical protein